MRKILILLATSSLAACGGTGPTTVGATAVPSGNGAAADAYAEFVKPTVAKTYKALGGSQKYTYSVFSTPDLSVPNDPTQIYDLDHQKQVFAGNASTLRDSKVSLTYDPRDAIFTLTVVDRLSGAETNTRFQDSANRTQFGDPAMGPQWGTPNLGALPGALANPNVRYVQGGDGNPISPYPESGTGTIRRGDNTTPNQGAPDRTTGLFQSGSSQATTFFYEVPGSTTKYVTFAGYIRNSLTFSSPEPGRNETAYDLERGAFAYGILTDNDAVPKSGTGSYTGSMLATAVFNPTLGNAVFPTYFQWINGTAATSVNFATSVVDLSLTGVLSNPFFDASADRSITLAGGTSFSATGRATIDLVRTGGFTGSFSAANFGGSTALNIAGSSIDGAFYGPKANEVGGGFRIVGGVPNQRVDIMGAFTGR